MHYDDHGQSVVYEDENYLFGDNESFKLELMFHIDNLEDERDFHRCDNYFSSRDMLLKVTHIHNRVHFWHVNPDAKSADFDQVLQRANDDGNWVQAKLFE